MFEISSYASVAGDALKYRGLRQDILAGNIANIDTPNYKAKDINFEDFLAKESNLIRSKDKELELARTDSMHFSIKDDDTSGSGAEIFFRPNHATRNDGNSVDLDIETTEMSKNAIMINAISAALKKKSQLFKNMIDTSSRVS
jgi:flagellar basal-body rod protein FlgB